MDYFTVFQAPPLIAYPLLLVKAPVLSLIPSLLLLLSTLIHSSICLILRCSVRLDTCNKTGEGGE